MLWLIRAIRYFLLVDVKEERICINYYFKLEKPAREKQEKKRVYCYEPETKRQASQCKSPSSPGPIQARQVRANIKSILMISLPLPPLSLSLLCEGIIHQKFVPPGQTVNQHNNRQVLELRGSKSAHNVPNDSETKTGWFTVTMRRRTLLCQRASFWTLTRGCDSTRFLLERSGSLWFILVSENEIVTFMASIPGCTEYSRTMADCPTCDFKNSLSAVTAAVEKIPNRLHAFGWGQQQQIKKMYGCISLSTRSGSFGNALSHRCYPLL